MLAKVKPIALIAVVALAAVAAVAMLAPESIKSKFRM